MLLFFFLQALYRFHPAVDLCEEEQVEKRKSSNYTDCDNSPLHRNERRSSNDTGIHLTTIGTEKVIEQQKSKGFDTDRMLQKPRDPDPDLLLNPLVYKH